MNELIKIGQLAKESGATIDTIRFYEDKGILAPKTRSGNGYRYYGKDALNTLSFIQMAKGLGFTLAETKEFLEIQVSKKGKCSFAQKKLDEKLIDIDSKITNLKSMKMALKKTLKKCGEDNYGDSCQFLDLLGG